MDFFQGGAAVVNIHFTNSKVREKYVSIKNLMRKYQISKPKVS